MIVHIPHGGLWRPARWSQFSVDDPATLTDVGAREIFEGGRGDCIVFPVDRLVCDVERLPDGEPMEAKGMGICYENDAMMERFRDVDDELRIGIIEALYRPHHERLKRMVDDEVRRYGRCLIIDGHTFSPVPLPYEDDDARPEIDVGYEDCEEALGALASTILSQWYDVMENRPFSGSLRPLDRLGDLRVASVMIEVRQDLNLDTARERIQEVMARLEEEWYGEVEGYVPVDGTKRRGLGMLTDKERHEALDALAKDYSKDTDAVDLIMSYWDDKAFDEKALEGLRVPLSLYYLKDEGDWREGVNAPVS